MSAPRRRPDFLGVGVQRSGTTYVQFCLEEHPEIGKPESGLHFFSHAIDYNWDIRLVDEGDFEWYETQLGRFSEPVVGEYSVTYGFSEHRDRIAAEIAEHYPDVKILIVLRNPVDRAISEFGRMRQRLDVPGGTTMAEFIDTQPLVLDRGRYSALLDAYFSRFPAEQIHVKVFEDMRADAERYIESLYEFLGVDPSFRPGQLQQNPNPSRPIRWDGVEKFIRFVEDGMRPLKTGPLSFVHGALKGTALRKWVRAKNVDTRQIVVTDEVRARLAEIYRDDVQRVEERLGRDLSAWHRAPGLKDGPGVPAGSPDRSNGSSSTTAPLRRGGER